VGLRPEDRTIIVFCAGFLVPQRILGLDYFRAVGEAFPHALFPPVPPLADIASRASALADAIRDRLPPGPLHLVAHSMGGLDARFMLGHNLGGLAQPGRVVSLSTISTPHRGSPIADLLVGGAPGLLDSRRMAYEALQAVAAEIGLNVGAFGNLTTGFAEQFNQDYPDLGHVRYLSYAGMAVESLPLQPFHDYIQDRAPPKQRGANDGLVTVNSAMWDEFPEPPWATDHFGEIGHRIDLGLSPLTFDHVAALRRVLARVGADGGA
jgi:triacylglycerol lipase